ncbi:endonuclease MutS2 [Cytobacillus sp. IB215665]|uniref:endonuclease MutS2 n=1 Tax=Cytobacillus sp. IB215665 TaxID=3097357 RepID=UPI002A115959|nr:endonuclease MutS2 [Cytobacillus sp. IB215665]MDX8366170.1 endonuclease MutS2 [Cytobacillus sp. IB215665]
MNEKTFQALQFDFIKNELAQYALTEEGKKHLLELSPSISLKQVEAWLHEVEEAVYILRKSASVPIHGLNGITKVMEQMNKGVVLKTEQLTKIYSFLDSSTKLKRFMKDKEFIAPRVTTYVYAIEDLPQLAEEIIRCIKHGRVDDYATKELQKIRKQLLIEEVRLKDKVQHILQSKKYQSYLQEPIVSQRDGRYVIPIKKEYKRKVEGNVVDASASGSTIYLEPAEVANIQERIDSLKFEEDIEIEAILSYLTGLVEAHQQEIGLALETMIHYDVLFAKGKYSEAIGGIKVQLNESHFIDLRNARHPMLGKEAVPLSVQLGNGYHALVITGPNTGGKTVSIKTIGLLTLMVQCGLFIPVDEGSHLAIYQQMFVDIGDGQSIEQNLSTFSSRITNVIDILANANDRSLVLIDELGSGTDPGEGMGLSISILDELYEKGATIFATTHFSEMKEFATEREGFRNGSMEFDIETLRPTYRLIIGEGGDSQAFSIALKLGIHPKIIEKAHSITYKEHKSYEAQQPSLQKKREIDKQIASNKYVRRDKQENTQQVKEKVTLFEMGDNVKIGSTGELGIVYKGPDQYGNYIVQVKDEKRKINHKRMQLYITRDELYPEDYDFDIIFKSKDYRKKNNLLNRKHIEGIVIETEE